MRTYVSWATRSNFTRLLGPGYIVSLNGNECTGDSSRTKLPPPSPFRGHCEAEPVKIVDLPRLPSHVQQASNV